MKLFMSGFAPSPRRVAILMAEKGIDDIAVEMVDLARGEQFAEGFRTLNPLAQVPVLMFDDGRVLSESRAISSWLEARHPTPNLMGTDAEEHAFIEMWDRRMELALYLPCAQAIRHSHPGFKAVEPEQNAAFAAAQRKRLDTVATWLDQELAQRDYIAGARYTVADITAFCAIDFARLLKYSPAEAGLVHLQAWRDRIAARPAVASVLAAARQGASAG